MVLQAYRKLKETFADFSKPDGDKETPAKTCRDLLSAHPDKPSGEVSCSDLSQISNICPITNFYAILLECVAKTF